MSGLRTHHPTHTFVPGICSGKHGGILSIGVLFCQMVVSVGGCKEVVAMRYFPVKKETEDNIIVHIPRDAAMILAD